MELQELGNIVGNQSAMSDMEQELATPVDGMVLDSDGEDLVLLGALGKVAIVESTDDYDREITSENLQKNLVDLSLEH